MGAKKGSVCKLGTGSNWRTYKTTAVAANNPLNNVLANTFSAKGSLSMYFAYAQERAAVKAAVAKARKIGDWKSITLSERFLF